MAEVSIDRSGLSLAALVAGSEFDSGDYWLDSLVEPEFDQRTSLADESGHVAGGLPTQSVQGLGSWQAVIYAQGADAATLKANKRALEAAVRQFRYTATLTIVGAADTYTCFAGRVSWGTVDSGMVRGLIARAAVTVPCLPLVGA